MNLDFFLMPRSLLCSFCLSSKVQFFWFYYVTKVCFVCFVYSHLREFCITFLGNVLSMFFLKSGSIYKLH